MKRSIKGIPRPECRVALAPTEQDVERFHTKYIPEPNSGCWLWDCDTFSSGYGRFRIGPSQYLAHRVSYVIHVGPIPKGMYLLHSCDVTGCVNPAHLRCGTQRDNVRDMIAKGRGVSSKTRNRKRATA